MKRSDNVEILFCDNHLLIALKPADLLTQGDQSKKKSLEDIAKNWVKKEFKKPGNVFLHPIHRLDRPVSGLVLFGRTSKALSRLNELSRNLEIQRVYQAEVEGILPDKLGRVDHYLIHGDYKAIVAKEGQVGAKHARLTFEVLHYMPHSTLLEIELETGRYHQIRAQFGAMGHPIIGDKKYGSQFDEASIRLHCKKLSFKHPVTQEVISLESPAPFA